MIAVYLLPVYLLVNRYLLHRIFTWLSAIYPVFRKKAVRIVLGIVYLFVAFSPGIGFLTPPGEAQRFLKGLGYYWMGIMLYMVLVVVAADLIRLVHTKIRKKTFTRLRPALAGALCLILITAVSIYGMVNARWIRITPYQVKVEKQAGDLDSLKIALVADLHLGYSVGTAQMRQMVDKINAQNPDLVVIAGDIFDNEYEALDDPQELASTLADLESTYGTYACYGNHDIQEPILAGFTFHQDGKKMSDPRMDTFLKQAGITLLRDETIEIDHAFYLCGRPDYERPGRGIDTRKTPKELTEELDLTKPLIVIDHEPRELNELSEAGVDLDLCGHTHDGQVFPLTLITDMVWENACGYLKKGSMHNIVTSGVGVFGPNMRVGTKSEICMIDIQFLS
ncbi:metallophosphoesterase [Sellimonas intestinalis]|uniref:metallophosphoesterase n=1 Tax=Sellimonas intestinalis TaxID=1653434 RepID=UPI0015EB592B|nr:metallophosphoesterase [Sellimonas intestinalis]MBA2214327.1 metallophosphoesterase [Sellimonas intestinalis]